MEPWQHQHPPQVPAPSRPLRISPVFIGIALGVAAAVGFGGAALCVTGKKPPDTTHAPPQEPSATNTRAEAINEEAQEAAAMILRYFPIGQKLAKADWAWATCHDETPGFNKVLACAEAARAAAVDAADAMGTQATATSPCGKEIERAHRAYIEAQRAHHKDSVAWLEQHRAVLAPRMQGRSLHEACADTPVCEGRPSSFDKKYDPRHGAEYRIIGAVECTQRIFTCEPPRGNVCFINKVADRLSGEIRGTVTVAATGLVIR